MISGGNMLDNSKTSPRLKSGRRPSISFWIVAAILLLLVIVGASTGGFGGVLIILGITALITGLYAFLFKRRSWAGIPHRKSALLVAGSGIAVFIVGGMVVGATASTTGIQNKSALVATSASATATPTAACLTASDTKTYNDELFVCTMGTDQRLVWLPEAESKKVVAKVTADKVAADKAAADKAAADKAASDKAAADKAASDKAAADQAAAQAAKPQVADPDQGATLDPKFGSCKAANEAGYGNYISGVNPEYAWYKDADHDGRVCEK
jgi:hypothetical protein